MLDGLDLAELSSSVGAGYARRAGFSGTEFLCGCEGYVTARI
ncbi:hypothetical protein [Alicyclobacillus ferrooxydans]|nr:hypothetical protein [Alicyclobacillus ferrooxydans]